MPFVFVYILKLSVSLAVVFLFYHFVLRKLTFYNWNRLYLLGYTLLSFFIPFIDISTVLQQNQWSENSIVQWLPVIGQTPAEIAETNSAFSVDTWQLLSTLLIAGMGVMLFRLLVQLISFRRMMRKAAPVAMGSIPGSKMKLYQVEENIIPFSFGNSIFINHHLHTPDELREIVWHEFIHVKQKHSLDIICGELLCLINWFNPFAWLIRRSIRQNLEFIADNKVLENGISRKEYQYLLLKVIGNNHFSIAPKFNFSSLKKRIAMMNKMKSAGVHIVKFLFILPLLAVLLVAFRKNYEKQRSPLPGTTIQPAQDTVPARNNGIKLPKEIVSIHLLDNTASTSSADPIKQKIAGMVGVKRTDGEIEIYELGDQKSLDKFEKKYGVKLEDIVPPPPVPAIPPAVVVPVIAPSAPLPPAQPVPAVGSTMAFTPVADQAGGINLSGISREYEITDKKAELKLLDGTIEKYDLTNPKEKAAFEKKYGKIIQVNANVNANVTTAVNAHVNSNVNTTIAIPSPRASAGNNVITTVAPAAASATTPQPASLYTTVIDPYGHVITGKEDIVITITKKTTRQELETFIIRMKEKGVELDFDEVEYNEKAELVSINGTMKCGDSRSNFVATDFERLVLAMIKKGDRTYFKVNTRDNKTVI